MRHVTPWLAAGLIGIALAGCGGKQTQAPSADTAEDPPQVTLGERLFLETRFSQFFAVNSSGNVNQPLATGDAAVDSLPTLAGPIPSPFQGQEINCRQCHLVDDAAATPGGGFRSYADFARRSITSVRGDGQPLTVRNSPALVNATIPRAADFILHGDGEFTSTRELVRATITGRMGGWLPTEQNAAIAHIARVVREDDGSGALASDPGGGAYRSALSGSSSELRLPREFQINVNTASDSQIVDTVSALISAYVESLQFLKNTLGVPIGSPYDLFLSVNNLPATPAFGESDLDYARRLRTQLAALAAPKLVQPDVLRRFQLHIQPFGFTESELRGLRVFLSEPASPTGLSVAELAAGGVGNCVSCHAPPSFTDSSLHSTGISQLEYDGVNGAGRFAVLTVPALAERQTPAVAQASLPATHQHPDYLGLLRAVPESGDPRKVDLGAWNIFANPDFPNSQTAQRHLLCAIIDSGTPCETIATDALLTRAIAAFKTPGLRDLSDSEPYMHNGAFDTIEDAVGVYVTTSAMARAGTLRNADPRLANVAINTQDQADLAAFLRALNEDYN